MKKCRKHLIGIIFILLNILSQVLFIKLFKMINGDRGIIMPCSFHSRATSNLRIIVLKITYFGHLAGNISLIKM